MPCDLVQPQRLKTSSRGASMAYVSAHTLRFTKVVEETFNIYYYKQVYQFSANSST